MLHPERPARAGQTVIPAATPAPAYYGPTPIFFELIQRQPPRGYIRSIWGNGNELEKLSPVIEPSAVLDPGQPRRRLARAIEAHQSPDTTTITLGGRR